MGMTVDQARDDGQVAGIDDATGVRQGSPRRNGADAAAIHMNVHVPSVAVADPVE